MIDPKLLCKALSRYVSNVSRVNADSQITIRNLPHDSGSLPLGDLRDAPGDTETGHSLEELESETENVETAMEEELEAHFRTICNKQRRAMKGLWIGR